MIKKFESLGSVECATLSTIDCLYVLILLDDKINCMYNIGHM